MGCGGSKADESPLVTLCRERKDFLKAASDQRYALAAAHVSYFRSLKHIGDALTKFADQDLILATSPILTLPDHTKKKNNNLTSSSSTSISPQHLHQQEEEEEEEIEGSHLHLSSGSDSHSDSGHIHIQDSPEQEDPPAQPSPSPYPYGYHHQHQDWDQNHYGNGVNTYAYYMKRSAPHGKSMVYEEPQNHHVASTSTGQWPDSSYGYGYQNDGFFGFRVGSPPPPGDYRFYSQPGASTTPTRPPPPPAPPSPPRVSAWDFLNFFDSYDNGYQHPGSLPGYGYGSNTSSPDSKEVREREGIPELEDETEHEVMVKEVPNKEKNKKPQMEHSRRQGNDFGEGTSNSKAVPSPQEQKQSSSEGSSKTVRFHGSHNDYDDDDGSVSISLHEKEIKSSPDSVVSKSSIEEVGRKKGVSFDVDVGTVVDGGESSKLSSVTTLSPHGTRDIHEVVQQIRDEFEIASDFGREVAVLLEVYKPPYRSRTEAFKGINVFFLSMSSLCKHFSS